MDHANANCSLFGSREATDKGGGVGPKTRNVALRHAAHKPVRCFQIDRFTCGMQRYTNNDNSNKVIIMIKNNNILK